MSAGRCCKRQKSRSRKKISYRWGLGRNYYKLCDTDPGVGGGRGEEGWSCLQKYWAREETSRQINMLRLAGLCVQSQAYKASQWIISNGLQFNIRKCLRLVMSSSMRRFIALIFMSNINIFIFHISILF